LRGVSKDEATELGDALVFVTEEHGGEAIRPARTILDCFAELAIGRRFGPNRWLAMTAE
jgi:hypothetical protein